MSGYGPPPRHPVRLDRAREGAPVLIHSWMDVYHLTQPAVIECPDCEALSPPLEDVYALAVWTRQHGLECPA